MKNADAVEAHPTYASLVQMFEPIREDLEKVETEFYRHVESQVDLIPKIGRYIQNGGGKRIVPEGWTPELTRTSRPRLDLIARPRPPEPEAEVPERITIEELRRMREEGAPHLVVDVRTERSYRDDRTRAKGALRLPPDDAVRLARERRLDPNSTLVLYCA